jgi:hypothetical protein
LIEGKANHRALRFKHIDAAKVMPKTKRNLREVQTAAAGAAISADLIAVRSWKVIHALS